ncbi:hypothetical protein NDU88_008668 [Pleurodeles waltl]|uniref:Uncharacterized protein n=1 Tax=Pleurodeles waltl TaxID=8319 RepID=A0AAV7NWP5_PLEWA|nr:hypothetical protein NDU88_008668 [Pleurodeles waltl]
MQEPVLGSISAELSNAPSAADASSSSQEDSAAPCPSLVTGVAASTLDWGAGAEVRGENAFAQPSARSRMQEPVLGSISAELSNAHSAGAPCPSLVTGVALLPWTRRRCRGERGEGRPAPSARSRMQEPVLGSISAELSNAPSAADASSSSQEDSAAPCPSLVTGVAASTLDWGAGAEVRGENAFAQPSARSRMQEPVLGSISAELSNAPSAADASSSSQEDGAAPCPSLVTGVAASTLDWGAVAEVRGENAFAQPSARSRMQEPVLGSISAELSNAHSAAAPCPSLVTGVALLPWTRRRCRGERGDQPHQPGVGCRNPSLGASQQSAVDAALPGRALALAVRRTVLRPAHHLWQV